MVRDQAGQVGAVAMEFKQEQQRIFSKAQFVCFVFVSKFTQHSNVYNFAINVGRRTLLGKVRTLLALADKLPSKILDG